MDVKAARSDKCFRWDLHRRFAAIDYVVEPHAGKFKLTVAGVVKLNPLAPGTGISKEFIYQYLPYFWGRSESSKVKAFPFLSTPMVTLCSRAVVILVR